jgi:hypothetical protein
MARRITRVSPKTGLKFWTVAREKAERRPETLQMVPAAKARQLGATPGSLFVPAGTDMNRLSKRSVFISRSSAVKLQTGFYPTTGAKARAAGAISYKTAAAREQALRQIETRKLPRELKDARDKAATRAGFAARRGQARQVLNFLSDVHARHELYLATGRGRIPDDEYRRAVHLGYKFLGPNDDRVQRMQMSFTIVAEAA